MAYSNVLINDRIVIDPPFRELLAGAGFDSVERVLACKGDHLAAWSRTSDTIRSSLSEGSCAIYIKRYHYPRWKQRIRGMFRGTFFQSSRARSEYKALHLMRQLGIQAVRPIAYGERRMGHFLRSCFLITEAVPDAMSLSTFIKQFSRHRESRQATLARREILTCLARQVRHMHEAGFVHRDLFWRNVLIRSLPDDTFEFYFLDASVGKRIRIQTRRQESIVRDVAAMGVLAPRFCSKADQLRFLLVYLNTERLDREDRQWLRRVQARSDLFLDTETQRLDRKDVFEVAMPDQLPDVDPA
jgi:tRNA A-37 threonylcarbamoyl transferase component Bud32